MMIHTIQMPIRTDYYSMTYLTKDEGSTVVMAPISEEIETMLDKGITVIISIEGLNVKINASNIYCYGEIDLSNNSDDYKVMSTFNFMEGAKPSYIYSNYDYKNNNFKSDLKEPRWTETTRPEIIAQYAHGHLGKPKRIVLFKYRYVKR